MPVNGSGNPVFLEACQDYLDYLDRGKKRDLKLPEYETNDKGEIITHYGEVFCRVKDCEHGSYPLSRTTNLRAHLQGHGLKSQRAPSGRLNQKTKNETMAWYAGVIAASNAAADEDDDDDEEEKDNNYVPKEETEEESSRSTGRKTSQSQDSNS